MVFQITAVVFTCRVHGPWSWT